jgi:hypothetical protein
MDALLTLEPRVAGEVTVEASIGFADDHDDLHDPAGRQEIFCTTDTMSYHWVTTVCYMA